MSEIFNLLILFLIFDDISELLLFTFKSLLDIPDISDINTFLIILFFMILGIYLCARPCDLKVHQTW